MASNIENLNELWDKAFISSDVNKLVSLVSDDYVREIVCDNTKIKTVVSNNKDFRDKMNEFFDEYEVIYGKNSFNVIKLLPNNEAICMGEFEALVKNKSNEMKKIINGSWTDIRVKCYDSLWRIKITLGVIKYK
jgi:hypothetical protein